MSSDHLFENDETASALQPDFVISAYWDVLNRMAAAWLTAGARFFGIWRAGQPLAIWPDVIARSEATPDVIARNEAISPDSPVQPESHLADSEPLLPTLTAQIRDYAGIWGELGVIGMDDSRMPLIRGHSDNLAAQARLSSDAEMLSALLQRELDLAVMTDDLSESQDQMLALSELAQSMRSMLDVSEIIHALTYQAMRLTKACATFTWFADSGMPPLHQDQPAPFLEDREAQLFFDQVRWNNRPLLFDRASSPVLLPAEVENLYVIPIQFGDMTADKQYPIAALGILFDRPAAALSPDLKLGRAIARQAEVYFENCLLHQEAIQQTQLRTELELARNLQFRLLPQNIPHMPGLDISAIMRPAKEVGGDFYGINMRQDGSIIFSVGDAAGKGMPAALLMSMSHTVISSAARHVPMLSPQVLITRAVQDLYNDFTETGLFVTLFVCQYRPEGMNQVHSPVLVYANAGHSPVIYRPVQGPACLLEADAPPMGVLPESLSADYTLPFGPGNVIVIATDGFSEASNQMGEMYAYDNLLKMVDDTAARSAAEIAAHFFRAIDEFAAGIPQQDDQTLVVIKGVPK